LAAEAVIGFRDADKKRKAFSLPDIERRRAQFRSDLSDRLSLPPDDLGYFFEIVHPKAWPSG